MSGDDSQPVGGRRTTQAALVALCILGLLVAAIAAPTVGAGVGGGGDGPGDRDGGSEATRPDGDGDGGELDPRLYELLERLLPEQDTPDTRRTTPECRIRVSPDPPKPGRNVTVTVVRGGAPVEGALVHVDGETVGRTGATGRVRTRTPYVRDLSVRATPPDDVACATTQDTAGVAGASIAGSVQSETPDDDRNVSRTYEVDGEVSLSVIGTPDPGTTVTLVAVIEGAPMRRAAVTVDGQRVGETDEEGRYALTVPDDGTERLDVRVERGDFAGSTTVAVRFLNARVVPGGVPTFPGDPVVVRATLGEDPVPDAVVTHDGHRLGTTDGRGQLRIDAPADPLAELTVRTDDRTATAGVWWGYAGTALGSVAVLLALLVVVGLVAGRGVLRGVGARAVGLLARLRRALVALGLLVTSAVERALDRLAAHLRRAWTRLVWLAGRAREDLPALLADVRDWLAAAPGRAWRRVRTVRDVPRRLWRWLRDDSTAVGEASPERTAPDLSAGGAFDLRAAFRTVARRVVPGEWRARTPGEVLAAAVERDLPREPVERLVVVFEEVEYGDRSLTAERRRRARSAFDALVAQWRETDAEEGER